jgi:hypothetical protein
LLKNKIIVVDGIVTVYVVKRNKVVLTTKIFEDDLKLFKTRVTIYSCKTKLRDYFAFKIGNKSVLLHRFIMGVHEIRDSKMVVDHINGDSSDNTRKNLRYVSQSKNLKNMSSTSKRNKSGYTNVYWHKGEGMWRVVLRGENGVSVNYGYFSDVEEAAKVAKKAREEMY